MSAPRPELKHARDLIAGDTKRRRRSHAADTARFVGRETGGIYAG